MLLRTSRLPQKAILPAALHLTPSHVVPLPCHVMPCQTTTPILGAQGPPSIQEASLATRPSRTRSSTGKGCTRTLLSRTAGRGCLQNFAEPAAAVVATMLVPCPRPTRRSASATRPSTPATLARGGSRAHAGKKPAACGALCRCGDGTVTHPPREQCEPPNASVNVRRRCDHCHSKNGEVLRHFPPMQVFPRTLSLSP